MEEFSPKLAGATFDVKSLFTNIPLIKIICRRDVLDFNTAQIYSIKPQIRFCAGLNPSCGVLEIFHGRNLWQLFWMEIKLTIFRWSIIPQKQFTEAATKQNAQENTCTRVCNFIKKETLAQVFSWEFCEILKTPFLENTSRRLLLNSSSWSFQLTEGLYLLEFSCILKALTSNLMNRV